MNSDSARSWPLHIFALLLIPMACWQVWIFPSVPNYYAQHFLLYPCLVFMLWAWKNRLWTLREAWRLARPFVPWLVVLFAAQAMAGWQSARLFLPEGAPIWRSIAAGLVKLGAQAPFVLFFALLCRVMLREEKSRRNMLRGAVWSFAALIVWCAVQAIYVYTVSGLVYPEHESGDTCILAVRRIVRDTLQMVSPWLEARWPSAVYDFYKNGAYALTLTRFNGFFEEASALSAMIGVFFAPLSLGVLALAGRGALYPACARPSGQFFMKNRSALKLGLVGAGGVTASLAIMIFCRSGTGQGLSVVLLVLIAGLCLRGRFRCVKSLVGLVLVAACVYAALHAPHVPSYFAFRTKVFNVSKTPRVITTLDTLDIITNHPLLGVGRNWYFAHLHNGERYLANLSDPELRVWKERGSGGELSALPALAAQYGLPLFVLALAFVVRVWWRLQRMRRARPHSALLAFMAPACTAWLALGLTASLGLLDIRNPLFCLPFFFFYAVAQGTGLEAAEEGEATCRAV